MDDRCHQCNKSDISVPHIGTYKRPTQNNARYDHKSYIFCSLECKTNFEQNDRCYYCSNQMPQDVDAYAMKWNDRGTHFTYVYFCTDECGQKWCNSREDYFCKVCGYGPSTCDCETCNICDRKYHETYGNKDKKYCKICEYECNGHCCHDYYDNVICNGCYTSFKSFKNVDKKYCDGCNGNYDIEDAILCDKCYGIYENILEKEGIE